jgi:polyhydroxyalkanoate synthesis regulator phasin
MFEEIRNGLLSSFGAVFLTKEKVEELCYKLVKEAKISKEDAQKLKEELLSSGESHWSQLEKSISETLKNAFKNFDLVKASEVKELEKRIEQIETRMAIVEKAVGRQDNA